MPENQATDSPSRVLSTPPGLQLIGGDAAGFCADGHCVLPASGHGDAAAGSEETDQGAAPAHRTPAAGTPGSHAD